MPSSSDDWNGREPGDREQVMGSPLVGAMRLSVYLVWTLLLVPFQALVVLLRLPMRYAIPRIYHRICCRIIGFDITVYGRRASGGSVLYVSNHSSYLDITVLGGLVPASFIAKSEVAGWPFFGFLAKLQQTVFVERKARAGIERQRDALRERLEAGDSLILFPEGTSSDGNRTLPFKTALFSVAALRIDGRPLTVQPVSVIATRLDGLPMGVAFRPYYAWYGDMDLAPHLWQVFCAGRIGIEVEFHPPVTLDEMPSRKALAEHCWREVALGVERAVTGRRPEPAVQPATAAPPALPAEATSAV